MWYQRSSAWYNELDADCIELLSRLPAATCPGGLLLRCLMSRFRHGRFLCAVLLSACGVLRARLLFCGPVRRRGARGRPAVWRSWPLSSALPHAAAALVG